MKFDLIVENLDKKKFSRKTLFPLHLDDLSYYPVSKRYAAPRFGRIVSEENGLCLAW